MKIFLSQLVGVVLVNRLDPPNLHSLTHQLDRYLALSTSSKDKYKENNLHFEARHIQSFGFSSRLVGNLLCMHDPLPKEYITHEVGIVTTVF